MKYIVASKEAENPTSTASSEAYNNTICRKKYLCFYTYIYTHHYATRTQQLKIKKNVESKIKKKTIIHEHKVLKLMYVIVSNSVKYILIEDYL